MEPEDVKEQIIALKERLAFLEQEQHRIDIQLVEIKSDLHYIKSGQDNLNSNLSKFLWIVGGGFLAAVVSWVTRGGLS
jgi:chromosome segregation ATPase